MGLGFKLNLKLGSPLYSHKLNNSSSSLPSLSRGRESSYDSARLSSSFSSSLHHENICNDLPKAHRSSSAALVLENDYSVMETIQARAGGGAARFFKLEAYSLSRTKQQMTVGNLSLGGSLNIFDNKAVPSSPKNNPSYFGLLMESINKLESMSSDSDVAILERNILQQLERLGALNLFHICLSRTLQFSTQTQLIEPQKKFLDDAKKTIIRSTKKGKRKSGRERNCGKASRTALPANSIEKKLDFSSLRRKANSKNGRLVIAKNEAEMSKGVKMVDNLENIRMTLEKETGRVATLSSWAEASGVEVEVLQQQLHFGWYCRDELLRSTRSLVLFIARNYRGPGIALEDIIQAGNIGVLQGAIRFDHTRGYRFSTYVQYWIRKSMSTLVARHSRGVRIPFTLSKAINQIYKAQKTLNGSHGKYPSDDEIAKFTGLTLAKINAASKCLRVVGSLDQRMGDSISAKILDFTPDKSIKSPEETVMKQHMIKETHNLLKTLEPTERQVLVLRFGLHGHQRKSLEEIGRLFGVSKEWIRRVERKALMKLRNEDFCRDLSHYIHL